MKAKKKKTAAKAKTKKRSILKTGMIKKKAHASSRNRRNQAKKDGRGSK